MPPEADAWKRMVLRSMPPPAWLASDAPQGDVVLSSRARILRNLAGYRFPHAAERQELEAVLRETLSAVKQQGLDLESHRNVSEVEREHLIACRLASHHFDLNAPGRALLLDPARSVSMMINEEDHLRIQALSAGLSIASANNHADAVLKSLERQIRFAFSPRFGVLAASPYNTGIGRRLSSMFHLIGLAQSKRLPDVLKALAQRGIAARGLFGEASRAVGAFVQVSVTSAGETDLAGACDYLLREERNARALVGKATLTEKAKQALEFAIVSPTISLADATRVLAWVRWAAVAGLPGFKLSPREADALLTTMELRPGLKEEKAAQRRATFLREALGA